jgi:type IV pilus assembly protein PilE
MQRCQNRRVTMSTSQRTGFTLIEMLIVLVIMSILSALAYPSYLESVRKTRRAEARTALTKLMQQQERFYTSHNTYIAFSSTSVDPDALGFQWFSGATPAASAYEITGSACDGEVIRDCVLLTATPGTSRVNAGYQDATCAALGLTSTGKQLARLPICW